MMSPKEHDYSNNSLSKLCFKIDPKISDNVSDSINSCPVIYVLDGKTDQ